MSVFRGAVTDSNGQVDVGNLALFWVMVVVLGVVTFDCVMTAIDYFRCKANCRFDPLPLGQAVGLIGSAFAACLAALGAYLRLTPQSKGESNGGSAS